MQKKSRIPIAIGCAGATTVGLALTVAAIAAMIKVGQQIALERERREIANSWQPPPESTLLNDFFPLAVDDYEFDSKDYSQEGIADFNLDMIGQSAIYISNKNKIDVFVFPATSVEKQVVFQHVNDVFEQDESGFKTVTNLDYRVYYASSKLQQNHFWWVKGWLFVFRTEDSNDVEPFIKTFLQQTTR